MNEQPGGNEPQNADAEGVAAWTAPTAGQATDAGAPPAAPAPAGPPAPAQEFAPPAMQPVPQQGYAPPAGPPVPPPGYAPPVGPPAPPQAYGSPAPQPTPAGYPAAGYAPTHPAGAPAPQTIAGPTPPRKRLGTGAIVAIIAGGIALLLALIVGIAFAVIGPLARGGSDGAKGAVEAYFTAIADADAETALTYLDEGVASSPMITDEALAASQEIAPLANIVVGKPEVSGMSGVVPVSYTVGDTDVSTELSVYKYDSDGTWTISGATGQLSLLHLEGLQPTINGIPVEGEYVEVVVPGGYEFGVALPNFSVEGETTVVISEASDYPDSGAMQASLTDEAKVAFRAAVTASVNECIASTSLEAGCGLTLPASLSDGTGLTDGTIVRTLSADTRATLDALEPTLSYSNPTLAEGSYVGGVEVSAECSQGGSTGTCSVLFAPSLGTPSMNFATENPVVEWD